MWDNPLRIKARTHRYFSRFFNVSILWTTIIDCFKYHHLVAFYLASLEWGNKTPSRITIRWHRNANIKFWILCFFRTVICIWTIAFHINYHSAFTLDNIPQLTMKMEYFMYQPIFQAYLYVDVFFVLRCEFSNSKLGMIKFNLIFKLTALFYCLIISWKTKKHGNRLSPIILWKIPK